jgi:hypothetical protein
MPHPQLTNLSVRRTTKMARVTFWLELLLVVLILKQSDAAAYQSGELQEEIDRSEEDMTNTTELRHNNGEQAYNCCVS